MRNNTSKSKNTNQRPIPVYLIVHYGKNGNKNIYAHSEKAIEKAGGKCSPAGSHLQDRSATDSLGILKKQHKRNEPGGSISFRLCLFMVFKIIVHLGRILLLSLNKCRIMIFLFLTRNLLIKSPI